MGGHLVAHQVINRAAWMGEDPWAFYQREGYQVRARGGEAPPTPPPAPHAATVDDIRSRLGEMRGEEPAAAAAPQEPKNPAPLTAQDAWDRLAANKQKMGMKIMPGTQNETVTRIGTPKHAYARQEWAPGQMVDVGFVKDLLITGKDADGNWRLVRAPDEKGQSQEYIQEPHKGITKGEKVDFLETTKALRETAPEPASPLIPTAEKPTVGKPLTGGNAPPPEGGLFDENARTQTELFQKGDATLGGININQVPYSIFFDPNAREHTIVHELWHGFHEDMRRDLAHPKCPQQLKDDYVELMKWLDPKLAKDDAKVDALRKQVQEKPESLTLTTNEREKVARGGEIYAMTGVADNSALGRIFEKFREWVSTIYRAVRPDPVKGLMASTKKAERPPEMTDAARKVFDRWFTGYGEHPIISEPEMGGPNIHDEHELDLERAKQAPHEAVAIAEHAEGELEKHVKDAPEAIRLETGTASARPTEPVAEGGVERPGGAKAGETRAEPVKAGGGVGAGSGPVPARPGKPEEDTGGLRGKPTTALDIATRPASEGFRKPAEPDFTDKAGNLKKDWTTRDDNIWDTIVENYKNEPGIATPGRRTDKEVDDIVHSFGIPSHELADGILDKINNRLKEEDIQLLKIYFTNVASEVKRLADVYEKDPTNENLRDHLIAKARMTEIQNAMMTATAQFGRNLRTFRVMKDILNQIRNDMPPELFQQQLMEATGKTARQIRSEVAQLHAAKTPEEVARITARLPTLGGALEDFWKGNILSGLTTVSRIFCGQGTGLVDQLVERQIAGAHQRGAAGDPRLGPPRGRRARPAGRGGSSGQRRREQCRPRL